MEVRKVQPRAQGASVYVSPGVFAVGEEPPPPEASEAPEAPEAPEAEPGAEDEAEVEPPPVVVFEAGDVVGPLGGVLRRKKRYMAQHYGASESWQG